VLSWEKKEKLSEQRKTTLALESVPQQKE